MAINPASLNALRVCGDALKTKADMLGMGARGVRLEDVLSASDDMVALVEQIKREAADDPRIASISRHAETVVAVCDEIEAQMLASEPESPEESSEESSTPAAKPHAKTKTKSKK
jgi:hypothetical protein